MEGDAQPAAIWMGAGWLCATAHWGHACTVLQSSNPEEHVALLGNTCKPTCMDGVCTVLLKVSLNKGESPVLGFSCFPPFQHAGAVSKNEAGAILLLCLHPCCSAAW